MLQLKNERPRKTRPSSPRTHRTSQSGFRHHDVLRQDPTDVWWLTSSHFAKTHWRFFRRCKISTRKPSFGGAVERKPHLTDRPKGLNLSTPTRRDDFLVRVSPLILSDASEGKYYELKCWTIHSSSIFVDKFGIAVDKCSMIAIAWINYPFFQCGKTVSVPGRAPAGERWLW